MAVGINANALVVLIIAFLVVARTPATEALNCGNVVALLSPCLNYARGAGLLPPACCNGVQSLNAAARTPADRQTACNCLKRTASGVPGINPAIAAGIPGKCHVNVAYTISASTDCSKIN